jgi:TonB-linked SusC/RagA family outer membrane protein
MRREAFQNDGTTPSTGNAPDLLVWDTTRYIDFKNLLIGGTAQMTNANVSVSGGTAGTQFLIGGNYTKETTVFPGDFADRKASFLLNLHHNSADKKFDASISAGYTVDKNNLMSSDLTGSINLPPNSPSLYDANGKLNWQENGVSISDLGFIQPLSYLLQKYTAQSDNLTGNINLSYRIIPSLVLRLSGGYNASYVNEININPQTSFDPNWGALGYSLFGYSSSKTWNAEPQLEYSKQIGKSKLSVLAGTTWQDMQYNSNTISAFGYASDILLQSISGAGSISASNSLNQYRYNALFGRVNYNLSDKYIVNLSGRRDGSSRFGPGKQFANFGAVGTAWTFSNEKFIQKALTFLSFGKLRGSYGTTGNDQIDDYSFLDLWSTTSRPYQNTQGLTPGRLFNPDYSWELNRKLEFGLEAGLLKDRILFTISYFRNRCGNQLISYILPAQTGFTGISRNFDALVQNKGWEITLNSKNIQSKDLKWSSSFVLSIPQNKLLSFPGLATSSYSLNYKVGQSLNIINRYQFLGVDPSTGIYHFKDINGDGTINRKDFVVSGNLDPKFYGGLQNSVGYKNWQLDIFFEFRKQVAQNYLASQSYYVPGLYFNQPTIVLSRWQKPGDNSTIQRFSQDFGTVFSAFASKLALSNGVFSDASYIRCKNLSLSYNIPSLWMSKIRLESARIYLQAQNLFTITNYVGSDPENHNFYVLPPLRTIVAGIQLTL